MLNIYVNTQRFWSDVEEQVFEESKLLSCWVLGLSCKRQGNFQTNRTFPSHISGQLHWAALKPGVCWQVFLWARLSNLLSFRGMFFSPTSLWVTLFPLILPERSQAKLSATFLIIDVNFTLNLTPCTRLLLGFLEDAIRVNCSQTQSYQLWESGTNHSGMNGSSLKKLSSGF